jgi:hypothetical protein
MVAVCSRSCPLCFGPAKVIESLICSNGTRRRRIRCRSGTCGHRWTVWTGDRPAPGGEHKRPGSGPRKAGPITEEAIRFVLTSRDLNNTEASRQAGISREMARLIRLGHHHAGVCPEIPRWESTAQLTCRQCKHWSGSLCYMHLPDSLEEGITFAADCSLFSPAASADP